MLEIIQLPALKDNYIYVLHEPVQNKTAVVDPAVAQPVLELLKEKGWQLDYILNTHHHADHIDGNLQLKAITSCKVITSLTDAKRIPGADIAVINGDTIALGACQLSVLATPGHTLGHVCYYAPDSHALFTGDTLFSMGCGRLFEGTAADLWSSLECIKTLPSDTDIYCAHEYTEANARFALHVDPENPDLLLRYQTVSKLRAQNLPTIPVSLDVELQTNPFLRCLKISANELFKDKDTELAIFTRLRHLKDNF